MSKTTVTITIDLNGPEGNVYYLLGVARQLCMVQEMDFGPICDEMCSGDYENAVKVFEREFGCFVELVR